MRSTRGMCSEPEYAINWIATAKWHWRLFSDASAADIFQRTYFYKRKICAAHVVAQIFCFYGEERSQGVALGYQKAGRWPSRRLKETTLRRGRYLPEKMSLFTPLTSASARLLFDFSRFGEPQRLRKKPTRNAAEPSIKKPFILRSSSPPCQMSSFPDNFLAKSPSARRRKNRISLWRGIINQ